MVEKDRSTECHKFRATDFGGVKMWSDYKHWHMRATVRGERMPALSLRDDDIVMAQNISTVPENLLQPKLRMAMSSSNTLAAFVSCGLAITQGYSPLCSASNTWSYSYSPLIQHNNLFTYRKITCLFVYLNKGHYHYNIITEDSKTKLTTAHASIIVNGF